VIVYRICLCIYIYIYIYIVYVYAYVKINICAMRFTAINICMRACMRICCYIYFASVVNAFQNFILISYTYIHAYTRICIHMWQRAYAGRGLGILYHTALVAQHKQSHGGVYIHTYIHIYIYTHVAGLMQAEVLEYCITPPSWHNINKAMEEYTSIHTYIYVYTHAAGLMQAEVLEYCITPPSWHNINKSIEDDIKRLREERCELYICVCVCDCVCIHIH
jgi:hypothetical protein